MHSMMVIVTVVYHQVLSPFRLTTFGGKDTLFWLGTRSDADVRSKCRHVVRPFPAGPHGARGLGVSSTVHLKEDSR